MLFFCRLELVLVGGSSKHRRVVEMAVRIVQQAPDRACVFVFLLLAENSSREEKRTVGFVSLIWVRSWRVEYLRLSMWWKSVGEGRWVRVDGQDCGAGS